MWSDQQLLHPAQRRPVAGGAHPRLEELATGELDVLVVGGGVVGTGCALDAVTRGLRVGMVEARDWASGTSSRSSKLLHGGLRYLEMLDFALVKEALKERGLHLQRLAPHLARPVPFLYPLAHRGWERPYVGAGIALYDVMAMVGAGKVSGMPVHKHMSRRRALREAPCLKKESLTGAVQYYDGQIDDARHVMMIARTAAAYGALCANRTRVVSLLREGERVTGARLRDLETVPRVRRPRQAGDQRHRRVDRRHAGDGRRPRGHQGAGQQGRAPGRPRGPDPVLDRADPAHREERAVRHPVGPPLDRRHDRHPVDARQGAPAATAKDIDYILEHVNEVLRTPLTHADVEGVYAGLRPLLSGSPTRPASCPASTSWRTPLRGWSSWPGASTRRTASWRRTPSTRPSGPSTSGCPRPSPTTCRSSARRASRALAPAAPPRGVVRAARRAHRAPAAPAGQPHLRAARARRGGPQPRGAGGGQRGLPRVEIVYAASHEGARHLDDVLGPPDPAVDRDLRPRGGRGRAGGPPDGGVLGWDEEQLQREVRLYLDRVAASATSQQQPDDDSAAAARLAAPEVVASTDRQRAAEGLDRRRTRAAASGRPAHPPDLWLRAGRS
jgi:glycerol-3-phosphate dehydrogenase